MTLSYYTSDILMPQLSAYIVPEYLLSYQNSASSSMKFNGVNYVQIVDSVTGLPTGTNFNYPNLIEWDKAKYASTHPYTISELDPNRGNTLIGFPFLVKASAPTNFYVSLINLNYLIVECTNYNVISHQVTVNIIDSGINTNRLTFLNTPVTIQLSYPSTSSFVGPDGDNYPYGNDIVEFTGSVISYVSGVVTIQMDAPCTALIGNYDKFKTLAVNNQKISLLPLGFNLSGIDTFTDVPSTYDWTYLETNRIPQTSVKTNLLPISLPNAGDSFRFYAQAEVNKHSIIPTFGVGVIITTYT